MREGRGEEKEERRKILDELRRGEKRVEFFKQQLEEFNNLNKIF